MPARPPDKNSFDPFSLVEDPVKKAKQLVRKITHSGETDLNKDDLSELKMICKACPDDLMKTLHKECMKHLNKDHSQVRVSTVKLLDYLFQKSHVLREKLLDEFDLFLELTMAITQRPKVQLKLPPPKKYAALLQELTAKLIHKWQAEFGDGYEKLRYAYKFLKEHKLVDFSRFQVITREQLIKQQKEAEQQERILTRAIENRLKEFQTLKPELEQLLAKIESLINILVPTDDNLPSLPQETVDRDCMATEMQQHGIANLSHTLDIEFSPYVQVQRNEENREIMQDLKEFKKELIDGELTRLIAIEKTINKRSDKMVGVLKEIIDLKTKSTNIVFKLSEMSIVNEPESTNADRKRKTLDDAESNSSDSEFDEVAPKEGLETYIPTHMRYEYGLTPIDPRELEERNNVTLTVDDAFCEDVRPSTSNGLVMSCNVRLESGKLCPRRDKVKCPFHGRIIARDHLGIPLDEKERSEEEKRNERIKANSVPEWQDPRMLAEIKAATGIDLTMPAKGPGGRTKKSRNSSLENAKTCDLTPKKRLEKKLKLIASK